MLLKDRATNETMIDTEILAKQKGNGWVWAKPNLLKRDILINVGVHGAFGRRLKTQILQDTGASPAYPHIDKTTSKRQRTNDRCTNKSQTAAHDKGIQRRSPEDTVERGNPLRDRETVIKDVAVDVVDVVERREGDASAGAHKVQLRRARLPVVEGDHDDARYVRE